MKHKMKSLRIVVGLVVLVAALGATQFDTALGTLCVLCPVGFAQLALASQSIPWHLLPGVLLVLLIVFCLGRVFCAWLCPSSLLKNIFGGRTPRGLTGRSGVLPVEAPPSSCSSKSCAACSAEGTNVKTQLIVLGVLLIVSFIVRFPVFCLFCPIGLVFGTLWALNRVFVLLQPGWELIIFPLMLLAELFLFKRWCAAICPLGA
ncbi:MAG: 4Fe-4S binding protein, partial [Raoultibacter sp.]